MVLRFTVCTAFFAISGISLTYTAICSMMVVIMMATVISTWKQSVVCMDLFSGFSCVSCNCDSAMSYPRFGILLAGTTFLPSLAFPNCSSSYSWQTFSCHGYFLDISVVNLGWYGCDCP